MKVFDYKIVRCLSRKGVVEYKLKWIYTCKEWLGVPVKFDVGLIKHRVPFFLSLHAHIKIEEVLERLISVVVRFQCKNLLFFYDLIHGLICAYGMRDILYFWKQRI